MKKMLRAISMLCLVTLFGAVSATAAETGSAGDPSAPQASPSAPPAGHKVRYTLPYFMSENQDAGSRSTTVISVMNQSNKACSVGVQFQKGFSTTDSCDITYTIQPGHSALFCSRLINDPVAPCSAYCSGSNDLTYDTGHAFISTNSACSNIAVNANLIFTGDTADNWVTGISPLAVVKYNKPNSGD